MNLFSRLINLLSNLFCKVSFHSNDLVLSFWKIIFEKWNAKYFLLSGRKRSLIKATFFQLTQSLTWHHWFLLREENCQNEETFASHVYNVYIFKRSDIRIKCSKVLTISCSPSKNNMSKTILLVRWNIFVRTWKRGISHNFSKTAAKPPCVHINVNTTPNFLHIF